MSDMAVTPTNDPAARPVPEHGAPVAPIPHPHPNTAVPTVPQGKPVGGDTPHLGARPITSPSPSSKAPAVSPTLDTPTLPTAAQVALDGTIDLARLPTLPDTAPAVSVFETADELTDVAPSQTDTTGEHPMAHLMPARSKPTEASINAAELRAAKKAKAKKVKILVAIGALVVAALVGPPFVSWLTGAINEAGDTSSDAGE